MTIQFNNEVNVYKFLEKINYKSHIEYVNNKICNSIYMLTKIAKLINYKSLLILYYNSVISILNYGILILGIHTKLNQINCSQNQII